MATPIMILLCTFLLVLATGLAAHSKSPQTVKLETEVSKAAHRLSEVRACIQRVPLPIEWAEDRTVFIDPEAKEAWLSALSETTTPGTSQVQPSAALLSIPPGSFRFDLFDGAPAMMVSRGSGEDWERLVEVAVHEYFHERGEGLMPPLSPRGDRYPEKWESRYFRRELIEAMRRAVERGDDKDLRTAAYWRQRWIEYDPEDVENSRAYDAREGTAKLVGLMAVSLATLGCSASDRALALEVLRGLNLTDSPFAKDYESYAIGTLAGLLLQSHKIKNWESQVSEGHDALTILLEGVSPRKAKCNTKLEKREKEFYEVRNNTNREFVEEYRRQIRSPDFVILAVPRDWLSGSFKSKDFLTFELAQNIGETTTSRGITASLRANNSLATLQITDLPASLVSWGPTNTEPYFLIPIEKKSLLLDESGLYRISTDSVKASNLRLVSMPIKGFTTVLIAQ